MKNIKAYITGICGFAGSWLAEELLANGYRVRGAALPTEPDDNLKAVRSKVKIDRFDITDPEACRTYFEKAQPEFLFHLAAIASVGQSFNMAEMTFRVNVMGTFNIFEAVRGKKWLKKLIYVSSPNIYGPVKPEEMPLKPDRLFNPISPYAASKAATEYLARIYIEQYNLPVVIVRPFIHTGPRQNSNFVIPSFCQKIVAAEKSGSKRPVMVGNLSIKRDISDVRDIVRGYRLLAEKANPGGIYHLCSGKARAIGDLLNKLISLSEKSIVVKTDKKLYRKSDIPVLRGSYRATHREIGWRPEIKIDATLRDTLAFWRRKDESRNQV